MSYLYTVKELRAIEELALAGQPAGTLMQRAGQEAAELAVRILSPNDENARVLVLAGPGNNGGDALEMAIALAENRLNVSVLQFSSRKPPTEDASLARKRAADSNIQWEDPLSIQNIIKSLAGRQWDLIVDGLFGIGLTKPLDGAYYQLAEAVNAARCPVIALDVPSGLNADTGDIQGKNGIAIRATHTITFIGNKPGLYTHKGRDYAGNVHHVRLGVDERHFSLPQRWLNRPSLFSVMLRKRLHDSHKGSYGRIAILGGADGMGGAPVLAARAALHCGAGLTYIVYLKDPPAYDITQPELMFRAASGFDFSSTVSVVGPGLGTSALARDLLEDIMKLNQPLVLDADALNIISAEAELQQMLEERRGPTLLTPHPLEAARLLETTTEAIQSNRMQAAGELAKRYNAVVTLKGSGTIIADRDGKIAVNPTGGPALATPGTGDILSGICGALLAQGWPAWETALAAVWLHGAAADELVKSGEGPVGLTANELIPEVRRRLNRLVREYDR
ncbi:NAD(P)H-hydrate dehydratase [Oxalobacter sp. OttesenSCG-928-P03]|nr:NAD(P)H-hydrate dehydratase [Oxalobacter sp. OttesenSCG-928-P03]